MQIGIRERLQRPQEHARCRRAHIIFGGAGCIPTRFEETASDAAVGAPDGSCFR